MKTLKLQLTQLRLQSFVTSIDSAHIIRGGAPALNDSVKKECEESVVVKCPTEPENSVGGGSDTGDPNGDAPVSYNCG